MPLSRLLFLLSCPLWHASAITVCTTVQQEVAYMPEWLSFLSIQGVTRVVVGSHLSSDGLSFLPALFARANASLSVEVWPNPGAQTPWLAWCARRHRDSDWVGLLDNDEYPWSPRHGSLSAYLRQLPADVSQVHLFETRFGPGLRRRPALRVGRDGTPKQRGALLLVTATHTLRVPSLWLGERSVLDALEPVTARTSCNVTHLARVYRSRWSTFNFCAQVLSEPTQRLGKSFFRGGALGSLRHPHYGQMARGISHREVDLREVRINHYWVRSRRDAWLKASQWGKNDPIEWIQQAAPLWSAVRDVGLREQLQDRLSSSLTRLGLIVHGTTGSAVPF